MSFKIGKESCPKHFCVLLFIFFLTLSLADETLSDSEVEMAEIVESGGRCEETRG